MSELDALAPAPPARFRLPRADAGVLAQPERLVALRRVEELLSQPTAPYAEDGPLAVVRAFAEERDLELREDRWGNLIVSRPGRRVSRKLALSAHLDHPGLLYLGRSAGVHRAALHGGVPAAFLPGADLRFFRPGESAACATARIERVQASRGRATVVRLTHFRGRAARGMFATWDLTPGELRGARLRARVCDDLMGAAAILATFDLLAARGSRAPLIGVFTRAEETGFIGCLGLVKGRSLRGPVDVIGLECSPRRPWARLGAGPILRVGDAGTIFDPAITHRLQDVGAELKKSVPGFRMQRALMDGGRCESSAYNAWNVAAGGMCLALGNYHNCGPRGTIAPEYVDWNDYEGLVAWLAAAAEGWGGAAGPSKTRARLNRLWEAEYKRLASSAERLAKNRGTRTRGAARRRGSRSEV